MQRSRARWLGQTASVEFLERRQLLASATLRVVTYNIAADVDGFRSARPGLDTVLEAIGNETIGTVKRPIDILGLEETTSNAVTVAPIVDDLNTIYDGNIYAQSTYQGKQFGDNTVGNGPNAVIYNTKTLKLLASLGVGTPKGAANGEYRQVVRYEFQPIGGSDDSDFYVYVMHAKSGGTATDQNYRNLEAKIVRTDEAKLPASARVIYMGDYNLGGSQEASYQTFTASGQGQAFDPINRPGNWQKNPAFADIMSESSDALDYRDDLQLVTSNVLNDAGGLEILKTVTSGRSTVNYETFGNDGETPIGTSVDSTNNTALADLDNQAEVLTALTTASDHLPIVADYSDPLRTPKITSFKVSPTPTTIGTTVTLTATGVTETGGTISAVRFYRETNGTDGLQAGDDVLLGTGKHSGTTWTLSTSTASLAAGTYTYYAVAVDTLSTLSAVSSAKLTLTTSGGGGENTGEEVIGFDVNGQTNYGVSPLTAKTVNTGNTVTPGLTRGPGVLLTNTAPANAWGGDGWASTSATGITNGEYITFGLTVGSGKTESLSSIHLNYLRNAAGPTSGLWQYAIGAGSYQTIGTFSNEFTTFDTTSTITPVNLTSIKTLQKMPAGTVVKFRFVPFNGAGDFFVSDLTGDDLYVNGSVTSASGSGGDGGSGGGSGGSGGSSGGGSGGVGGNGGGTVIIGRPVAKPKPIGFAPQSILFADDYSSSPSSIVTGSTRLIL